MGIKDIAVFVIMVIGFIALIVAVIRIDRRSREVVRSSIEGRTRQNIAGLLQNFNNTDILSRDAVVELLTALLNDQSVNFKELRAQEMRDYELELKDVILKYDTEDVPAGTQGTAGSALRTERGTYCRIFIPRVEGSSPNVTREFNSSYYLVDTENLEVVEQPNLA